MKTFLLIATWTISSALTVPLKYNTFKHHSSNLGSLQMLDIDKSETLIFDPKSNRLYEADVTKDSSGDEFCLYDEKTGSKIFLTKV